MTADWLEQATRAAREVGSASPLESARTKRYVLQSVASRPARRAARLTWTGIAAVALVGGSAWAAGGTRGRLAAWLGFGAVQEQVTTEVAAHSARRASTGSPDPPALPARTGEPVSLGDAPRPSDPGPSPSQASARVVQAEDPLSLYKEAHALHFRSHDYARALGAWNRYLAVAPRDVHEGLAVEARYNRAICLYRLGRLDEARTELRPFADGAWGGYRQDDARSLLGGLDAP
jgi:tetratricopeptide (TPR) repeat protein